MQKLFLVAFVLAAFAVSPLLAGEKHKGDRDGDDNASLAADELDIGLATRANDKIIDKDWDLDKPNVVNGYQGNGAGIGLVSPAE